MKLPKNSGVAVLALALAAYIAVDTTGVIKPDSSPGITLAAPQTDEGEAFAIDSSGFIDLPEDPGNGDSGVWFIVDAVVTIEKMTDDPGRPQNSYEDVYILIDQFVFISFEKPVPILDALNQSRTPVAGGMFTKVYRIRQWSG